MTNCKNCGAPLHGMKCDYCKTEYAPQIFIRPFTEEESEQIRQQVINHMIGRGKLYSSAILSQCEAIISRGRLPDDPSQIIICNNPKDTIVNVRISGKEYDGK